MAERVLDMENLHVSFDTYAGEVKAVRGVTLHVDEGEVLAIVGESGCGKSVTAQTIMKLNPMPPARIVEGSINLAGHDVVKASEKEMQKIRGKEVAMIFQDPMTCMNPTTQVGKQIVESIKLHRHLSRQEAKEEAVKCLRQVNIPNPEERAKQYPHEFSGGMRQRAMIAMALSCNPKLLIADEPTTALDVTIQSKILELIQEIQKKRQLSVIYITHDLGVVAKVADYVNVMYAGKIVESGTVEDVFYDPRHPYTWALLSSMPDLETREKLEAIPGTPPDMILPPKGDAFAARNKYAMEIDFEEQPPMFRVSDTHFAATWLLHPDAPKVEPPKSVTEKIERMKKEQAEREAAEALQNAKKGAAEA